MQEGIEVRTKYTVDAREYGNLRECEVLAQQAVDRDRPQVSHQGGARVARRGIFLKRHWNTILSLFYSDFCFARARRRLFLRSSRCGIQPQILCLFETKTSMLRLGVYAQTLSENLT